MVLKSIARFVLSIFLVFSLIGFVFSLSFFMVFSEKNIEKHFKEGLENSLNAHGTNLDEEYDALLLECESDDSINIANEGGVDFEISCDNLKYNGRDGFADFIVTEEYKKVEPYILIEQSFVKKALLIFGILCLVFAILIGIISIGKLLLTFGIIFVFAGLPFMTAGIINGQIGKILKNNFSDLDVNLFPEISKFISGISSQIFTNFVIIFVIGIILLVLAFVLLIKNREKTNKGKNDS
ncbi:hypothetical protein AUJ84_03600 [Candidatus Pacearchaeota archaeon CG1_02_32_132]|nr:MAG: hypothetical protein AUJ84_03600 [Candidatus Pacearchaeota archaeon CG1_02_32_132]